MNVEPQELTARMTDADVDASCNEIIAEAMRRISTLRGSLQVYTLVYSAENTRGSIGALHYVSNAGRRGTLALLDDCRRGLIKQNRRLDS